MSNLVPELLEGSRYAVFFRDINEGDPGLLHAEAGNQFNRSSVELESEQSGFWKEFPEDPQPPTVPNPDLCDVDRPVLHLGKQQTVDRGIGVSITVVHVQRRLVAGRLHAKHAMSVMQSLELMTSRWMAGRLAHMSFTYLSRSSAVNLRRFLRR